jgi:Tfp pilus assembly protein FimT
MTYQSRTQQRCRGGRTVRAAAGFTLVELLTVMIVAMALVAVTIPAIKSLINRGRMVTAAQQIGGLLRAARFEAIRRSCTTVVSINYTNDSITAFADLNNAAGNPGSDLIYDPPAAAAGLGTAVRTYDFIIQTYYLPNQLHFWGAADSAPHGADAVNGFTASPVNGQPNIAVFNSDGSIQATGAFKIGEGSYPRTVAASQDNVDNFLAVNVNPLATARIYLTKYNPFIGLATSNYYEEGCTRNPQGGCVSPPGPYWVWY